MRSPLPPSVVAARLAELLTNEDQLRRRQNWLNRIGNYGNTRISGRYVRGQLVLRLRGGNNWRTDAKVEIVPQM